MLKCKDPHLLYLLKYILLLEEASLHKIQQLIGLSEEPASRLEGSEGGSKNSSLIVEFDNKRCINQTGEQ